MEKLDPIPKAIEAAFDGQCHEVVVVVDVRKRCSVEKEEEAEQADHIQRRYSCCEKENGEQICKDSRPTFVRGLCTFCRIAGRLG